MTDLEDRLRRDLRAAGERTHPCSIRPLQAPDAARRQRAVRRRRAIRIVAPVTAAVAVIGIVAGVALSGQATGRNSHRNSGALVAVMLPGKTPPYYVVLAQASRSSREVITATVRSSSTGAALSSVVVWRSAKVSPLHPTQSAGGPLGISADAGDRRFAISTSGGDFLLQLSADGRSPHLSRIPSVHTGDLNWGQIALSPSGTELAVAITYSPGPSHLQNPGIEVLSLTTGAKRIWVQRTDGRLFLDNIAWAPDGSQIAFQWGSGYGLLDLTGTLTGPGRLPAGGPGADLFRNSVHAASLALITTKDHLITDPDGGRSEVMQVVELRSLAGGIRRVLYQYTIAYHGTRLTGGPAAALASHCQVVSEAARGVHALIACPGFGRLDGSKFTSLRGAPPAFPLSAGLGIWVLAAW